jgi:hypothetical protein
MQHKVGTVAGVTDLVNQLRRLKASTWSFSSSRITDLREITKAKKTSYSSPPQQCRSAAEHFAAERDLASLTRRGAPKRSR